MDFMQYFNLYLIIHMTWLIAIFENIGMLLKHLLRILKQKNLALPRRKKRVIPRTLCLGANGCSICFFIQTHCYVREEVFQLHHFESLVSSVGVNF